MPETPEDAWAASNRNRVETLKYKPEDLALMRIAAQLDLWADESKRGGWSTHQVDPMRRRAAEIRRAVAADAYSEIAPEIDEIKGGVR